MSIKSREVKLKLTEKMKKLPELGELKNQFLLLLVCNDVLDELRANDINNSADPCCNNR